jgi:heavy metal sensor kinase
MTISTRARLTVYFTALFGAIVVALAIAAYVLVRNDTYSKLDSALRVAVDGTAMSATHELNEHPRQAAGDADLQAVLQEMRDGPLPDTQILVREHSRQVAYKASQGQAVDLRRIAPDWPGNAANWEGVRVAYRELPVSKFATHYQIYAAKAIAPALGELRVLTRLLLLFVPLGLGLAALAGYLLARETLAPLEDLTQAIDAITSSHLSARVNVRSAQDDIGQLGSRFNSLLDRLQAAFDLQRRFMADASHELRTPVTVALAAAQVTARDAARTLRDCEESLDIVEQQMLRLKKIIGDMLFLSQADASSLKLDWKEMYLDDAVSEASRAAKALARAKQQSFRLDALPEARCWGDQELLTQAILIVLDNSVKFTPPGGSIEVTVRQSGNFWICAIQDSGAGIPEKAQPHIFDRFFRAHNSGNEKVPGAGLGLPIAKSIVESHGGNLRLVQSHPGSTTFEISIPVFEKGMPLNYAHANSFAVRI